MRLLLVEDDDHIADTVVTALMARGFHADRTRWGLDVLTSHHRYDAIVLDLALPDIPGLQVLRQLRAISSTPVVILAGHADERSVVRALRGGADDCMVRPPRVGELIARLEKATRHIVTDIGPAADGVIVTGDVRVDVGARRVEVAGEPIPLTRKEFELVRILVERPGMAVSRQQLMDRVWGDACVSVSRSLDVHITWLRAKLDRPGLISTIRGHGYRWGDPAGADAASPRSTVRVG
ncbi:response regulator transcription factor [Nocardia sp. NPDC051463]|uniref:response regulator transcription factor n=1 Tax=Nocardia sp. NPDC051463 TaxID=3154845 RepID=UPI00344DBC3A